MKRIEKIQKQLASTNLQQIEKENIQRTEELTHELSTNLEFSLDVDPENKYNMSDEQKTFVKNYVEFKSIPMAADLSQIDLETAKMYFIAYSSQQEIRRINRAMYQRQFSQKLLTIDEIGGYLSSLILDENVPLADRVKTMDKVRIAQMLIDLQMYKHDAINNPDNIIDINIESQIKDLSVKSIKALISESNKKDTKKETKNIQLDNTLSVEEEAFLKTLPAKEILEILNEGDKNGQKK